MKQFAKRHLALLLAAVMVLTMLPVSARAEECTHENWGHKLARSTGYVAIDDTYHGNTFYYSRVCVDCGTVIMDVDPSQTHTQKEYHQWNYIFTNECDVCRYKRHSHNYQTSSTETKVEQVDSTYHNVITTTYTKCSCGAEGEPTVTTVQEAHSLDSSRKCTRCGYQAVCTHENQSYEMETQRYERVDGLFHVMYYSSYEKCLDCGKILKNYGTSSTQEYHKKVPEGSTTSLVSVDDTYHNIVTTTRMRCPCGFSTNSTSKVQEAHTVQSYSYDTGHPHQKYGTCACGAKIPVEGQFQTANGVQQDAAKCCICHGHRFGAAQEAADGSWRKTCASCGVTQAASAPSQPTQPEETKPTEPVPEELPTIPHTHQFFYGPASPEHPHYAYGSCSCGATSTIQEYHFGCCACTGKHKWGYPVRLSDGSFKQVCTKCDATQTTVPSEGVKNYYKLIDMIKFRRNAAARYQEEHGIDSATYTIWKTIAEQATDKLTERGFVGVNETLNSFSDMKGSIAGVFTEETWDEQQTEIWKSLLIKMLQNRGDAEQALDNLELIENVGDGFDYYGDAASTILDWFEDSSAEDAKQMKENIRSLETSLGTMGEKIKEYKNAAQLAEDAGDTTHQFTNAVAKLEELSDQYQKDLEEINRNDWTKDSKLLGYAFDAFSITVSSTINASASAEYAGILADLKACTENVAILEDICKTAKATGNANLEAAASQLKEEIQTEAVHKLNTVVAGITGFVDGVLKEGAEMIIEKSGEKALKALGASTKALEVIEMGAKLTKFFVDWDASYQAAQKLMTINQMDATMNILDVLKEEDDPYMAELWGLLHAEGCAQAQEFLTAWEDGTGLNSEDLGIDNGGWFGESELPDVLNELDAERDYYITALKLPLEKSK